MVPSSEILAVWAAVVPSADEVRNKTEEVLARRDFQLHLGEQDPRPPWWWDIVLDVLRFLHWMFSWLDGLPDVARWSIVLFLSLSLLAILGHMGYSLVVWMRGARRPGGPTVLPRETALSIPELERRALALAEQGDWLGAIRGLFQASLARLSKADERPLRKGSTNHEILRRYRKSPLYEPLSRIVALIDTRWYGDVPCENADFLQCQGDYAAVRGYLEGRSHAVRT